MEEEEEERKEKVKRKVSPVIKSLCLLTLQQTSAQ